MDKLLVSYNFLWIDLRLIQRVEYGLGATEYLVHYYRGSLSIETNPCLTSEALVKLVRSSEAQVFLCSLYLVLHPSAPVLLNADSL